MREPWGRLQVGELLPLWIFADLPPVQHIKIEAWHYTQALSLAAGDRSRASGLRTFFHAFLITPF